MTAPEALQKMLDRYPSLESLQDYKNALKEIVQEIALLGLWRAKFFEKAAFYGGTALRILYQLDRFSENLDFTLLKPIPNFNLDYYEKFVQDELASLGFEAHVEKKQKSRASAIESAFIKINTIQHLLLIGVPKGLPKNIHSNELMKIRFEVDTDPPENSITTENALMLLPYPFTIKTLRLEDLFAGKVHAALCREWRGRVKGRDWYDLIWFVSKNIPLNLNCLKKRMCQSGHWKEQEPLNEAALKELFATKINKLDVISAKEDIINFIADSSRLDLWSKEFFLTISQKIRILSSS